MKTQFMKSIRLIVMPKLSPTMEFGKIEKWYRKGKDKINSYDLVLEVSTNTLTPESTETSLMEIEIVEDMYVAKIIRKEGDIVPSGRPIAILCDNEEDIEDPEMSNIIIQEDMDVYHTKYTMAIWQGYIKSGTKPKCVGCN